MDAEGYVKITGRIKDMIIRGGENVIHEKSKNSYTAIRTFKCRSLACPMPYGEQVAAWVQVRDDSPLTTEEIREYCAGQITHFKVPRYIKLVDEYPMTVTGKMQKFVMRDQYAEELGLLVERSVAMTHQRAMLPGVQPFHIARKFEYCASKPCSSAKFSV